MMKKRFWAMLLAVCMVISVLPTTALAAPGEMNLEVGDEQYIGATYRGYAQCWSSNNSVVKVIQEDGNYYVVGVSAGTAEVTYYIPGYGEYTWEVTVTEDTSGGEPESDNGISSNTVIYWKQFYGFNTNNTMVSTPDGTKGHCKVYLGTTEDEASLWNLNSAKTQGDVAAGGLLIVPDEGYYVEEVVVGCKDGGGYNCRTAKEDNIAKFGASGTESTAFIIPAANLQLGVQVNNRYVWHSGAGTPMYLMVMLGESPNPVTVTYDDGIADLTAPIVTYKVDDETAVNESVRFRADSPSSSGNVITYSYDTPTGETVLPSHIVLDIKAEYKVVQIGETYYEFTGWTPYTQSITTGEWSEVSALDIGDTVKLYYNYKLVANWRETDAPIPDTASYTVKYYQEALDGTYTEVISDGYTLPAEVDTTQYAIVKTYTGFTLNTEHADAKPSGVVTADDSLVLKLYYDRAEYTVTYRYENSVENAPELPSPATVEFGDTYAVASVSNLDGYTFDGWYYDADGEGEGKPQEVTSLTMPAADVELTGSWVKNPDPANLIVSDKTLKTEGPVAVGDSITWEITVENTGDIAGTLNWEDITDTIYYRDNTESEWIAWTGTDVALAEGETLPMDVPAGKEVTIQVTWEVPAKLAGKQIKNAASTANNTPEESDPITVKKQYTVTYQVSGEIPSGYEAPEQKTYNADDEVTVAAKPTASGYSFKGWTTDNNLTITDGKFIIDQNVVFTGVWTKLVPAIEVTKTLNGDRKEFVVGNEITWTVKVDNTKGTAAGTVTLTEKLAGAKIYDGDKEVAKVSVDAGKYVELTAKYTVAGTDAGTKLKNTIEVTGDETDEVESEEVQIKAQVKVVYYLGDSLSITFSDPTDQENPFNVSIGTQWTVSVGSGESADYVAPQETKLGQANYVYDPVATAKLPQQSFTGKGNATVKLVYSYDGNNDHIPDQYQVTVKYEAVNGTIISEPKSEVLTIYDEKGNWASTGTVTISGAEAESDKGDFNTWTTDSSADVSEEDETLSAVIISAEGGKTYTFTANFGDVVDGSAVTKSIVTAPVDTIEVTGVIYPETNEDGSVKHVSAKVGDEVTLLYAITIPGAAGDAFVLTEEVGTSYVGCVGVSDLRVTMSVPAQYIGTLDGTSAVLYFTKTFTITADTKVLTNSVVVNGSTTTEEVPVFAPGIEVTKTSNAKNGKIEVGKTITYTITVKNTGNVTLKDVVVKDIFTAGGNGEKTWNIGELEPGASKTVTFDYKTTSDDLKALVNKATASGTPEGGNPVTDESDPVSTDVYYEPPTPVGPPKLNYEDHYAYIVGYPDGLVHPEKNITRAEVATIFFRMLLDESREYFWAQENDFSDVVATDWFNNAVSTLANANLINGYPDGSYRPNNNITRAEFATIAIRFFLDEDVEIEENNLSDVKDHWAEANINLAYALGLIEGYPDDTFRPNQLITRAEAMTIVNRVLKRAPHEDHLLEDMIQWPDNMDERIWYYADVQEATNSHEFHMYEDKKENEEYEIWTELLPVRDWAALEREWSEANSSKNPGEVVDINISTPEAGDESSLKLN